MSEYLKSIKSIPITTVAEDYGFNLVYKSKKYESLKEHDSVTINKKENCFWRNSVFMGKGFGGAGSVIDFAMMFGGYKTAADAIKGLAEKYGIERDGSKNTEIFPSTARIGSAVKNAASRIIDAKETNTKTLALPSKGKNSNSIYRYLVGERKINKKIVGYMQAKNLLYEDDKNNCVFVSNNFACIRGTSTTNRYVGDVSGSDYSECFFIRCSLGAKSLIVTESVIDAMSIMSQFANANERYTNYNYLSLCGTNKIQALFNHLERDKNIDTVMLAFDNDDAGKTALKTAIEGLKERGYNGKVVDFSPPEGNDWNEFHCRRVDNKDSIISVDMMNNEKDNHASSEINLSATDKKELKRNEDRC